LARRLPEAAALGRRVKATLPAGLQWGACHGDLFRGNRHATEDGTLTLFDFDECGMGYRAYDLAVYLWTMRRENVPELFEPFRRGYCEVRTEWQRQLAVLRSAVSA
jgi:Ser/Thr protein kinase RdoA (MazF antagonist)